MRSILRHGDIEWPTEYFISNQESTINSFQHPEDTNELVKKYENVFWRSSFGQATRQKRLACDRDGGSDTPYHDLTLKTPKNIQRLNWEGHKRTYGIRTD